MGNSNVIDFQVRVNKINLITEKLLETVPDDMKEAYCTNTPIRILFKFDSLDAENQNKLFDYLMCQARKSGRFNKSSFVINLLSMIGGQAAWKEVENIADIYLLREGSKHVEI